MGISAESKPEFDPAEFNDVLALQTNWDPVCRGGSNFRTRRLVQHDLNRVEFRPTAGAIMFGSIFGILGGVSFCFAVMTLFSNTASEMTKPEALIPGIVGLVFMAIAIWMIRSFTAPIIFDLRNGCFWKGRISPMQIANPNELKCFSRLESVHTLQLISEFCSGKDSSYFSYELNLILKSGDRINVFDHGNLKSARSDAKKLAEFLGCPLWDAIQR